MLAQKITTRFNYPRGMKGSVDLE